MPPINLGPPKHRKTTRGDVLAQCLRAFGVNTAPSMNGKPLDVVMMECNDSSARLIAPWEEIPAVDAMEGHLRYNEKIDNSIITACSEVTAELPGLVTSMSKHSMIYVVTGSPSLPETFTTGSRGSLNNVKIVKRLTKFAHRIMEAEEVPRLWSYTIGVVSAGFPGITLQAGKFA